MLMSEDDIVLNIFQTSTFRISIKQVVSSSMPEKCIEQRDPSLYSVKHDFLHYKYTW